jgi:aminopeptidase N
MKSASRTLLSAVLFGALGLAMSCSSASKKNHEIESEGGTSKTQSRPTALSRETAHLRARQLARVTYTLWFGLDETHEDYEGRAVINFELRQQGKDLGKPVLLDFEEGTIRNLRFNGQVLVPQERFDGHRITFKPGEIHTGNNRVEIAFNHNYSHNGTGLHRFKDPVDGLVYLYSNFEPYDAHRMFPCFDQPDLKASYELTVETPEEWQVIANTPERDVTTVDGHKSWQFPPSPLFSTYVFALHAGPYAVTKGDAEGIPIRLFSRQSIKQYVDADEWLDITRRGLDFYSTYFGYPYPYAKYDQVIVPDFNAGAMENVGAVTFSERYINRSKATQDRHRRRASTILHEMAHMWFGDLVTMRWWNGLWLNESFATFMATKAVDEATNFKGSWQGFFSGTKQWAYWEDQLVTTHPIEGPVFDTDQAKTNFDGITYGKGASSLKQLNFFLGDEDFREGLQRYFQKFALRNTTVTDFVKMLAEASNKDLTKWQKSWLQTSGVNTVRANWTCAEDGQGERKINAFSLNQSVPEIGTPELRAHRTEVAFYKMKSGKLHVAKSLTVSYQGASTPVGDAVGLPCPDFVYPNHLDWDYVKVDLDPVSLAAMQTSLNRLEDPFARQMVWHNLWEMVLDGKVRASDYAQIVLSQLGTETDTQVLANVLHTLVDPMQDDTSVMKYMTGSARDELWTKIGKFTHDHLSHAPSGSDLQLIWFKAFLDSVRTEESQKFAQGILNGKSKLPGLKIDQERRWEIIQALARNVASESQSLITAELKADNTDMGQKAALIAQASTPDSTLKKQWLDAIVRRELPYPKLRELMSGFHGLGQEDLSRMAIEPYFEMLPKLASLNDEEYLRSFAASMYPGLCDPTIVARVTALLAAHSDLPASVVKSLKIARQEDERCIRARAK